MPAFTRPRPIRVVFLVEENDHWQSMISAIFSNCYSRWGGRFNLIIPCEHGAPRPAFLPWIEIYDPDIIYSYVDLTEDAIRFIHELINPSFLVEHVFIGEGRDERAFHPKLPLPSLGALSTCIKASYGGPLSGRSQVQLIDRHPACPPFPFLEKNFGTYRECSQRWPVGRDLADCVKTITLTPQHVVDAPRQHIKPDGDVITSEEDYFKLLSENRHVVGFSMLSAWDVPRIEISDQRFGDSFNLVVGNSFSDHLTFWNLRSYYDVWLDNGLVTLLVSKNELEQPHIFQSVVSILKWRNRVTHSSNSQATVSIRSMSVQIEELRQIYEMLNDENIWFLRAPECLKDIDEIVPRETALKHSGRLIHDTSFQLDDWHEIAHTESRFRPPIVLPAHLKEFSPLAGEIRQGMWAQDLAIERKTNLSRFANMQHTWRLPRRLPITDEFVHHYQTSRHSATCMPRVNSDNLLVLYADFEGQLPEVTNPDDTSIFRTAICNPRFIWAFKRHAKEVAILHQQIAVELVLSDKGRYLRALLGRAGTLNEAGDIFLHKFWLERFQEVGATPASTEQRIASVNKTLRRRFKGGEISSDSEWERLSKLVLQEARNVRLSQRFLRFNDLKDKFGKFRNFFWEANESVEPRDKWDEMERQYLQKSVQYLVSKRILHQGLEWRCRNCANNNWLSIDGLTQKMVCDVCGHEQPAPVSFCWQFRLDGFILDGLREHGLLSCLWALIKLSSKAKSSFYFSESIQLFYEEEAYKKRKPNAEVDLIAVVDGLVYLCEVKSSSREFHVDKFIEVAERIRPDVALLAVMGNSTPKLARDFQRATKRLTEVDVRTELMTLKEGDISETPHLPIGSSQKYLVQFNFG